MWDKIKVIEQILDSHSTLIQSMSIKRVNKSKDLFDLLGTAPNGFTDIDTILTIIHSTLVGHQMKFDKLTDLIKTSVDVDVFNSEIETLKTVITGLVATNYVVFEQLAAILKTTETIEE